MSSAYCPRRGDIVWIAFSPQIGHEQFGHRPALILSPEAYNRKTGLVILCPITSQQKDYPFEVMVPPGLAVSGVILSDQVKSFDWKARRARYACRIPPSVLPDVLQKLNTLLGNSE